MGVYAAADRTALPCMHVWLLVLMQDFLFSDILGTFAIPTLSLLLMIGYAVMLLIVAFNMLVRGCSTLIQCTRTHSHTRIQSTQH